MTQFYISELCALLTMPVVRGRHFTEQWASHHLLLRQGTHTDLQLACMDGTVCAHRLHLVSHSPFLASVLGSVPGDCAVICLPEVKATTLNLLLDVLYSGRSVLSFPKFLYLILQLSRRLQGGAGAAGGGGEAAGPGGRPEGSAPGGHGRRGHRHGAGTEEAQARGSRPSSC